MRSWTASWPGWPFWNDKSAGHAMNTSWYLWNLEADPIGILSMPKPPANHRNELVRTWRVPSNPNVLKEHDFRDFRGCSIFGWTLYIYLGDYRNSKLGYTYPKTFLPHCKFKWHRMNPNHMAGFSWTWSTATPLSRKLGLTIQWLRWKAHGNDFGWRYSQHLKGAYPVERERDR